MIYRIQKHGSKKQFDKTIDKKNIWAKRFPGIAAQQADQDKLIFSRLFRKSVDGVHKPHF